MRKKTKEDFEAGVERVWVIYPEFAEIYDYDSPTSVRILTRDQTLGRRNGATGYCSFPWRNCSRTNRIQKWMPAHKTGAEGLGPCFGIA